MRMRGFAQDERGAYTAVAAIAMPVLLGFAGVGTEVGLWLRNHQTGQAASDSAAVAAATAVFRQGNQADVLLQARAVTAAYGLTHGVGGVAVTVNRPPATGPNAGNNDAVEVLITQPQTRFFTAMFLDSTVTVGTRSVARVNSSGAACVLALNEIAAGATTVQGTADIMLNNCSMFTNSANASAMKINGNASVTALSVGAVGGISGENKISAEQGIVSGQTPINDPYSETEMPAFSGCDANNRTVQNTTTLSPGVYCGGLKLNSGANVTLSPGIYFMDRGALSVNGGATLTGQGVTIVYTSSTGSGYAGATINGGATVSLTAPTTGPMAGFAMFGDPNMPTGTQFTFNGGSTQNFTGAVYLPKANIKYAGGADSTDGCTQIVADTITFTGNANIGVDCAQTGVSTIGSASAMLVE